MSAGEFIEAPGGKDCSEKEGGWGIKSTRYDYIWKGDIDEDDYPDDACQPRYHGNATIDNLTVSDTLGTASVTKVVGATGTFSGLVSAGQFSSNSKAFNIPHPVKEGKRLWHGCLEGPEYGVYIRGRLTDNNVIELPEYWKGLVDPETITVHLTQIGSSQDLIVDKIVWGKTIYIKSGNASRIDCYYTVNAMRNDIPALEIEQDA